MERSMVLCGLVALCALFSTAAPARAEWAPDGELVFASSFDEGTQPSIDFGMVSDGQGGGIVFWTESREETGADILAQRIDSRGNFLWAQGGVAVCEASGDQTSPYIVSDGAGGWIFTWSDYRGEDPDIYAQRLDADGNPLWTIDGVAVHAAEGAQTIAGAISNGAGAAIIFWHDYSDNGYDYTIDAGLVDSNAVTLWTAEGVIVSSSGNYQQNPGITSDGAGGAIVTWKDFDGVNYISVDIRIQRLDSAGVRRWGDNGTLIVQGLYFDSSVQLRSDGSGGAMLAWEDWRHGTSDIFAQRVLSNGMPYWTDNGVPVCTAPEQQFLPCLVSDGSGGAIISWGTLLLPGCYSDIFAQRIDGNGNLLWAADGVPVCNAPSQQQIPTIVSDGSGGAIIAWTDFARGNPGVADIYAQHITGEGVTLWQSTGVPICTATGQQARTRCATDGEGGAIIAWEDSRSGKQASYIQRIDRNGNWGYPAPSIEAVRDVPGDQGGFVNLSWLASRLDPWPGHAISSYSIWRGISPEQAALTLKSGGAMLSNVADFAAGSEKPLVRIERVANRTFFWKLISTVSASHLDGYSEIVPTLFDSTAVCGEYHYFQVIAHGDDPEMYWISTPDSGRSIDNLPPAPPAGLAGTPGSNAAGLNLTWNRCCEADLGHYAVYRGATEGFEPGPGNRMAALADTMYMDGEWRAGSRYYYKVAAVDIHGNASGCSLLRPEDIIGGEERETPAVTFLAQNFPNPFNPSTKIVFGLKEQGFVSLRIYDAAGRLVRVLVEADRAAGVHEALWNGRDDRGKQMSSGLYFCRLKAGSFTSLRKMVLLK